MDWTRRPQIFRPDHVCHWSSARVVRPRGSEVTVSARFENIAMRIWRPRHAAVYRACSVDWLIEVRSLGHDLAIWLKSFRTRAIVDIGRPRTDRERMTNDALNGYLQYEY